MGGSNEAVNPLLGSPMAGPPDGQGHTVAWLAGALGNMEQPR
jgi:hypothetical protein